MQKTAAGYIDTMFSNVTSLLYLLPDDLLKLSDRQENVYFKADTVIITYLYLSGFVYYNHEQDTIYIGSFGKQKDQVTTERMLEPDNILQHINCFNSFSMSYQDFLVIKASWDEIEEQKRPYFMMYRDAQDAIFCQGFDTTDAMIDFVKSSMPDEGRMVGDFILD